MMMRSDFRRCVRNSIQNCSPDEKSIEIFLTECWNRDDGGKARISFQRFCEGEVYLTTQVLKIRGTLF
jgi:hypothetical protein